MRNFKFIWAIMLALVCFTSCGKDDDVTYTYLNEFIDVNLANYSTSYENKKTLIRGEYNRVIEIYSGNTTSFSYNGQNIYSLSSGVTNHLELNSQGSVIKHGNKGNNNVYRKYQYDSNQLVRMENYSGGEPEACVDVEYADLYEINITFTSPNGVKEETLVLDPELPNVGCVVDVLGLSSTIKNNGYAMYAPDYIYYLGCFGVGLNYLPKGTLVDYDESGRIIRLKYGNQTRYYEYR